MLDNPANIHTAADLYLDLLRGVLTRTTVYERYTALTAHQRPTKLVYRMALPILERLLRPKGLEIVRRYQVDHAKREQGLDWPPDAETMVGLKRLDNVRSCMESILADGVPGDILETGVWRGGCSIYMKGILAAHGDQERTVWLADSFEGLPRPDAERYPADKGDMHWSREHLPVSLETVQENFRRYALMDQRVRFLKGWFKDTMPVAPISRLAILRLDGDMYESTIQVLDAMYGRVSQGGFVIVDDYGLKGCRTAVDDFRREHQIHDEMSPVDWSGVYWRRS